MKGIILVIPIVFGILSGAGTPVSPADQYSYSFIHLSDTQHLSESYPATLNFTFSFLESMKNTYNISTIIITGDLVNDGDNLSQWNTYVQARSLTTIPLVEIPGDEDLDSSGTGHSYYNSFCGDAMNGTSDFNDFVLIGIGYRENPLNDLEISRYNSIIEEKPQKFTLISVHNYYNHNFTISQLGTSIKENLVTRPTFVLSGHAHGQAFHIRYVNNQLYVEDLTNYQQEGDFSAGRLYTVYHTEGEVSMITIRNLYIFPRQHLGPEKIVFSGRGVCYYPWETGNQAMNILDSSFPIINNPWEYSIPSMSILRPAISQKW